MPGGDDLLRRAVEPDLLPGRDGVRWNMRGADEQHRARSVLRPERCAPEGARGADTLGARLSQSSDDVQPVPVSVNGYEVLEKLAALPISTWNYKWDPPSVRHLGPMAQDFKATFGLGDDDRTINMVDANGVVMVAVQALHRRLAAIEERLTALEREP